ncbi:unnamed protein product [Heligmosomoides polygyrus]|uniref:Transposase n=1 Tax=Heligmosomoides polygyrus TaxID=6339 RepID=A0A183F9X3_HELPZ|nr:unnamed protein product [Heligmosomoides polygyrus]
MISAVTLGLRKYADSHNLTIANIMFRSRDSHFASFYSGHTKTQIGFILVKHRDRGLPQMRRAIARARILKSSLVSMMRMVIY